MRPSVGPERSQLLRILPSLTVRQFFSVSAYFFLHQHWRMPMFGGRLVFPCANIFQAPMFLQRQGFCMRQCFFVYITDAYIFVYFASAFI
jgi:hypothetical protein